MFKIMISTIFDFAIQSYLLIIINRSEDNYKLVWSPRFICAIQYYLRSFAYDISETDVTVARI